MKTPFLPKKRFFLLSRTINPLSVQKIFSNFYIIYEAYSDWEEKNE